LCNTRVNRKERKKNNINALQVYIIIVYNRQKYGKLKIEEHIEHMCKARVFGTMPEINLKEGVK